MSGLKRRLVDAVSASSGTLNGLRTEGIGKNDRIADRYSIGIVDLERLRAGGHVLIVDDAAEPPEAVITSAAAQVTPGSINFLVTHARGLVCLVLPPERMRQLGIPLIPPAPGRAMPAYCASIEARRGVSTGISASDRATTVLAAVAPDAKPADLVMPGHVTPIHATPGGTLVHAGLPKAASDLARLAVMPTPRRDLAQLRTEGAATLATPDIYHVATIEPPADELGSFAFSPMTMTAWPACRNAS